MKMQVYSRRIGALVILAGLLVLLAYPILFPRFLLFAEQYLSADHHIHPIGKRQLRFEYFVIAISLVILGGLLWSLTKIAARSATIRTCLDIVLNDPLCHSASTQFHPSIAFLSSSLIGLLLSGVFMVFVRDEGQAALSLRPLYREDGLFEYLTAIALVISSVLMGKAVLVLRERRRGESDYRWIFLVYVLLMLGFFFLAMEEISWGQRLFGWGTPDIFEGNFQNETNVHNFLNPYLDSLYRLASLLLLSSVLFAWWFRPQSLFSRFVLPHPSMVGLAFLIAWTGNQGELFEELVSLFALFYSFRTLNCVSSKSSSLITTNHPFDSSSGTSSITA